MARELFQVGSGFVPLAWLADTSQPRRFNALSTFDPSRAPGVVLAAGDEWSVCAVPVPPPDAFVLGATRPDATNTGVYDGRALTVHEGDLIITTPGTVVQNMLVRGIIDIRANNCTVRFCRVLGRDFTAYPGWDSMIHVAPGVTGYLIEFNECSMFDDTLGRDNWVGSNGYHAYFMAGIKVQGASGIVQRNNVHDCNHLLELSAGTHQVLGNYGHDPSFRTDDADHASDATHPYWSHNDFLHISGGVNHLAQGNSSEMKFSTLTGMNSTANPSPTAEQIWPNCHGVLLRSSANPVTGVVIKQHWFKYGAVGPHFTSSTYTGGSATLTGCRFTPDQSREFSVYTQVRLDPTTYWTVTDDGTNVYSDDPDTPLAWRGQPLKPPTTSGTTKVWQFNPTAHTP